MESMIAYAKIKKKVSDELSDDGIRQRLSSDTIHHVWKKVRNIAGVVFVVSSLVTAAPISIPVGIASWIGYITLVSGTIAGRAQLNKSKLLTKK